MTMQVNQGETQGKISASVARLEESAAHARSWEESPSSLESAAWEEDPERWDGFS